MTYDELWKNCEEHAIASLHPYDREFLWISDEYFARIEADFVRSRNWFHPGNNYRSKHAGKHIHAIEQGRCVHLHTDTGNLTTSPFSLFQHFYFDVIPYCWYSIKMRKQLWKLFLLPDKFDEKH